MFTVILPHACDKIPTCNNVWARGERGETESGKNPHFTCPTTTDHQDRGALSRVMKVLFQLRERASNRPAQFSVRTHNTSSTLNLPLVLVLVGSRPT